MQFWLTGLRVLRRRRNGWPFFVGSRVLMAMDDLRALYQPVRFFTLDLVLIWVPLWLIAFGVRLGRFSMNLSFMVASLIAMVAALVMVDRSGDEWAGDSSAMPRICPLAPMINTLLRRIRAPGNM